jgi:phosphatidylglycerol lysyltransferase
VSVKTQGREEPHLQWIKWFHKITPLLGILVFFAAGYFIHKISKHYSWNQIVDALTSIPINQVIEAIVITMASFAVLICYDVLAVDYVGKKISLIKVSLTSFIAFSFTNTIGLANIAGNSVRLRMYSHFGLDPKQILQLIVFISFSFWTGFLGLCGVLFLFVPPDPPPQLSFSKVFLQILGALALILPIFYVYASAIKWQPNWLRMFPLPSARVALFQILISSVEWGLAGLVLYVLLPADVHVGFIHFLSFFATAQVLAFLTHVPGGIGVIEATVIYFLFPNSEPTAAALGALLAFRIIYYILPFALSALGLIFFEVYKHRRVILTVFRRT